MKLLTLCLALVPLLTARAANVTKTPPQFDPDSTVCPGNCLGTYTNAQFASNNCSGTVGFCVCTGTLDSPPLGNLTTCLEGSTCKMSTADTQSYITSLLAFEGCTSTFSSVSRDSEVDSTSTSGGGTAVPGSGSGSGPPAAASSKTGGAVSYPAHSDRLVAFGVVFSGMLVGTMIV
ncbi:hypothetical protein C8R44DRAFT_238350 [Mycena epipterygia]|nr:hypothetical protein C8R44DRAFT_238350 [Mycena epipterygia]